MCSLALMLPAKAVQSTAGSGANQQALQVVTSLSRQQWETRLQNESCHGNVGSDMHATSMLGFVHASVSLPVDVGKGIRHVWAASVPGRLGALVMPSRAAAVMAQLQVMRQSCAEGSARACVHPLLWQLVVFHAAAAQIEDVSQQTGERLTCYAPCSVGRCTL